MNAVHLQFQRREYGVAELVIEAVADAQCQRDLLARRAVDIGPPAQSNQPLFVRPLKLEIQVAEDIHAFMHLLVGQQIRAVPDKKPGIAFVPECLVRAVDMEYADPQVQKRALAEVIDDLATAEILEPEVDPGAEVGKVVAEGFKGLAVALGGVLPTGDRVVLDVEGEVVDIKAPAAEPGLGPGAEKGLGR